MKKLLAASALAIVPFVPAGLASGADAGGASTRLSPAESLLGTVNALRKNDVGSLLRASLTDEQYDELRKAWDVQRRERIDPAEDAQFREGMAKLTEPGAENRLMAELEPQLEAARPQVEMLVGMFTGMASSAIQQEDNLDAADKRRAVKLLDSIGRTLAENDLTDPASARKTIGIVCNTARKLRLRSLGDVQRLSFDQLLGKGNYAVAGAKDILKVYGMNVDSWLDSVKAETVREQGDKATVKVSYRILDIRESYEVDMVLVDDRWLQKEAADAGRSLGRR